MEPYIPNKLPFSELDWNKLMEKVVESNRSLSEFNGMLLGTQNKDLLLSPLVKQEAVLSSKIEGTRASLDEVLSYEMDPTQFKEKQNDITEIINYRKAISFALKELKHKPTNLNMIKDIHKILLKSSRGENKMPGVFRKDQNYVGGFGEYATYIPPNPLILDEYLDNFINYYHYKERDLLVQAAIMHAQFEIIHPFKDGNGRVGRILIPLMLFEKRLISRPALYLSAYFDRYKTLYYNALESISKKNDWLGWISFFLDAVSYQSTSNQIKVLKMNMLYDKIKNILITEMKSTFSISVLDTIFKIPIINNKLFSKNSKIPIASSARLLNNLIKKKVLSVKREGSGRTSRILAFDELLRIVNSTTKDI